MVSDRPLWTSNFLCDTQKEDEWSGGRFEVYAGRAAGCDDVRVGRIEIIRSEAVAGPGRAQLSSGLPRRTNYQFNIHIRLTPYNLIHNAEAIAYLVEDRC